MSKEMHFFIYLLENYAAHKGRAANEILREWNERNLSDFIFDMYELYHVERLENAYADIDDLMLNGITA